VLALGVRDECEKQLLKLRLALSHTTIVAL
jgi:hypothetical protein